MSRLHRIPGLAFVLAGALLGAVLGAAWALTREDVYRAEVRLAVGQGQALFPDRPAASPAPPRVTATLAELVRSRVIAENVIGNLRLEDDPDELLEGVAVRVAPGANVIDVIVEDSEPQRAERIAQEIALVFSQLVRERFTPTDEEGTQLPLTAVPFGTARAGADPVGPSPARDAAIGAGLGAAAGLLAAAFLQARRRRLGLEYAPLGVARDGQLARRVEAVTAREREMLRRQAELARRERALEERERSLGMAPLPAAPEPAPSPAAPPPVPAAAAAAPPAPTAPRAAGAPTLSEIERLISERGQEYSERAEEWSYYVVYLRDHADASGRLPSSFAPLLDDVFGELLGRT